MLDELNLILRDILNNKNKKVQSFSLYRKYLVVCYHYIGMTLWARKKDFESAFEVSGFGENVDWIVEVKENKHSVVFVVRPTEHVNIDLERFYSSQAYSQMKGCGSELVDLNLQDSSFNIQVARSKLPDDYDE